MHRPDDRLAWAEAKTRESRRIALRYFGRRLRVERKADLSPVTIADRRIEEYLRREIGRAFPRDAIVGEEFGAPAPLGTSYWTIDPIDGTRAFSRGLPSWGTLIAWVEDGTPTVGAVDLPAVDGFLGVTPGIPAFERRAGRRVSLPHVKRAPGLADAAIFHGGSSWWWPTRYARGFARLVQSCYLERAYGDCYAYLWLFRGRIDAMIDHGCKLWDLAPMAALAKATGRVAINCAGVPSFAGPDTIIAHPRLAQRIARILTEGTNAR